jgi:hypothetical protein
MSGGRKRQNVGKPSLDPKGSPEYLTHNISLKYLRFPQKIEAKRVISYASVFISRPPNAPIYKV